MPAARLRLAVALFSTALLISELTLMRLFSVTLLYHFAFLVLSLALFGLGAGGIFHFTSPLFTHRPADWLPWLGLSAAAALPFSLWLELQLRFSPYEFSRAGLGSLSLVLLIAIVPFFLAGLFVSLLYRWQQEQIAGLYAADLLGAAIGCAAAVGLLEGLGATGVPWLAAGLMTLGALATAGRRTRPWLAAALLAPLLFLGWQSGWLQIHYVKGRSESPLEFEKWNAFSRIAVLGAGDRKIVQIDADAATEILSREWVERQGHSLLSQITGMVYRIRPRGKAFIMGAGGGRDVVAARLAGMGEVRAVELNPIIVRDLMLGRYFDYSGGLYRQPGVRAVVAEARHYLERHQERFDVIQGNAVDTWAAVAGGGLTLSESYLYTRQAFQLYLRRLKPDGIVTIGRWVFDPPQQMIRVVALALEAMQELRIPQPGRRIYLVSDPAQGRQGVAPGVLFFKKEPFRPAELQNFRELSAERGYRILYSPLGHGSNAFSRLILSPSRQEFLDHYPFDISPTSDDRPFFFFTLRWTDLARLGHIPRESRKNNAGMLALVAVSGLMLLLTLLCLLLPVALRSPWVGASRASYFLLIGLGFMMLETSLIQRSILFLGHPSLAFTVVVFFLLLSSGAGSALAGRVTNGGEQRSARRTLLVLVAALALLALLLPRWLALGGGFSFWPRVLWLGLPLLPLGLLLGRLFPLGVRAVSAAEVPWAWALNGSASVLGTALAALLAMTHGFQLVMALVPLLYAGCLAAWRRS